MVIVVNLVFTKTDKGHSNHRVIDEIMRVIARHSFDIDKITR
jgi:hypothetical protein